MPLRLQPTRPVYREIVREALTFAWSERQLWPIALLAGILQTAGVYDAVATALLKISLLQQQSDWIQGSLQILGQAFQPPTSWSWAALAFWMARLQPLLWGCVIFFLVFTISSIAQGALVQAFATSTSNRLRSVRDACLAAASRWPSLILLNLLSLFFLGLSRTWLFIPFGLSVSVPIAWVQTLFVLCLIAFGLFAIVVTSLHLFTLHFLMIREQSLSVALESAVKLFKRAWLLCAEIGLVLYVFGLIAVIGLSIGLVVLTIPLAILLVLLSVIGWVLPQEILLLVSAGFLLVVGVCAFAYVVLFQYSTWYKLFRRVNQNAAVSKIQRMWMQLAAKKE